MKNAHALAIAITLGIAAAVFNFLYLHLRSQAKETVYFLGIKQGVTIPAGEPIRAEDIQRVGIPKDQVGNLAEYAILDEQRADAFVSRPWRTLEGPALLLHDDVKAPPEQLQLADDEAAIGIPVDARSYPMSLVVPGDQVSFVVPKWEGRVPTPANAATATAAEPADGLQPEADAEAAGPLQSPGPTETIGPFTVLSLGNRLGSTAVMKANRVPQSQGNVMTIRVKVDNNYKLTDPKAQKLLDLLHATGFRQVSIIHFGRQRGQ